MKESPSEMDALVARAKLGIEPSEERLRMIRAAVLRRVEAGECAAREHDVSPPRKRTPYTKWWLSGILLAAAALWPREQDVSVPRAAPPVAAAPAPALEPVHVPTVEPLTPSVEALPPSPSPAHTDDAAPAPAPSRRAHAAKARRLDRPSAEPTAFAPEPHGVRDEVENAIGEPRVHFEARSATYDLPTPPAERRVVRATSDDREASLEREVALVASATSALARGDHRAAQRALDQHQLAHPVGQLQAERIALLARARCLAGDLEAARRLYEQLRLLAPASSLHVSVERACPKLAR